jgi:uncharacterized protein
MKYFCRPGVEQTESEYIGAAFGRRYEPHGPVSLNDECVLDRHGVETVELSGEVLAIHAETASWAFLGEGELAIYEQLRGKPLRYLREVWPADAGSTPEAFAASLYRRGLLSINGLRSMDHGLLRDSPNYKDGNLVELLLTERCNLACGYCLAGANNKMPAMNWDIAKRAVDLAFAMEEADTLAFEYAGGEPMLQFSLMQRLTDYIESHPLRAGRRLFLSIQTNATLLNDERARWLKEKGITVGISLDGKPASQNVSRPQVNGGESHSMLIRGIDLLQRHGVPFGALVVLNRSNVDSAEDLVDFLLDNSIHGFRLNPVAFIGDARRNWDAVGLTQEEIIGYFKHLMRLIAGRGHLLLEDNVRSMCEFLTSKQRRTRCMQAECGAGDTFQAVAASGDIYPCGRATQSPGLKLGNIFEEGLESLSAPARANPVIVQIRGRRPENLEGCPSCHYRQLCQSGCSAQAWESYGTVRHKTPECSFYKTLYPYLMRWLSFDGAAFDALNASNYFSGGGLRFDHDFIAPGLHAAPAGRPGAAMWNA